jgi:hypothetical protein
VGLHVADGEGLLREVSQAGTGVPSATGRASFEQEAGVGLLLVFGRMPEAVVAHLVETLGEDVEQEAAEESAAPIAGIMDVDRRGSRMDYEETGVTSGELAKQKPSTSGWLRDRSTPRRYPHVCEALRHFTAGSRVSLEVGCGGKQYGPYVDGKHFGLDLKKGHYPGVGADVIGSGLCMPVRSGSVDTVFMVATLLFMEEWQRPVDECCRVVRTGGRYVILDYKPRIAVRLGYPGRFTPQSLLARLAVNGLQGQLHTEFLPVHHVGPLRVQWVRRAVSRVLNLASSWIVVSAVKTQTAPER